MTGPHRLYAVVEQGNPFHIPDPPAPTYRFVELVDATWTYAVYQGDPPATILLGYVRHCPEKCAWIARTTGSETAPADIRQWPNREAAAQWLSKAVDGTVPGEAADRRFRTYGNRKTLVVTGLLALLLAAPALAEINPDPLDVHPERTFVLVGDEGRSDAAKWVIPILDGEAVVRPIAPPPARAMPLPEPPKRSLPAPGNVLDAVSVLRASCPQWQIGLTPGFETEAHVCRLLAGSDTAWGDGAVTGSWLTAAFFGGIWLLFRLAGWLASLFGAGRRVSVSGAAAAGRTP
jgi:hypothetical protein